MRYLDIMLFSNKLRKKITMKSGNIAISVTLIVISTDSLENINSRIHAMVAIHMEKYRMVVLLFAIILP